MKRLWFSVGMLLVLTNPMKFWANDEVGCVCLEWTQTFQDFFRFVPPDMACPHLDEERCIREMYGDRYDRDMRCDGSPQPCDHERE